ncbi:hypothetical protein AB0N93_25575 [Streptomyces sp. NPDC091267]
MPLPDDSLLITPLAERPALIARVHAEPDGWIRHGTGHRPG